MSDSAVGRKWSPVFLVGCPRSGTTLLRDLLRSHPLLTIPGESHFIPDFYRAYGDPQNPWEAERLAARILGTFWIGRWHLPLEPGDFRDCRTFRETVERLYETWARLEGKRQWGDKTPHYVLHMPLLARLFPEARFVHIYRDGRDVALSWLKKRYEPQNLYAAIEQWSFMVTTGMRDGRRLGPERYFEVRYETLISETEAVMRKVCRLLGLPWDAAVLRPNRSQRGTAGVTAGPPPAEVKSRNSEKWKTEMAREDRQLAESVAGETLAQLGYETNGLARPLSRWRQTAWRIRSRIRWVTHKAREKRWGKRQMIEAKLRARFLPKVHL